MMKIAKKCRTDVNDIMNMQRNFGCMSVTRYPLQYKILILFLHFLLEFCFIFVYFVILSEHALIHFFIYLMKSHLMNLSNPMLTSYADTMYTCSLYSRRRFL